LLFTFGFCWLALYYIKFFFCSSRQKLDCKNCISVIVALGKRETLSELHILFKARPESHGRVVLTPNETCGFPLGKDVHANQESTERIDHSPGFSFLGRVGRGAF